MVSGEGIGWVAIRELIAEDDVLVAVTQIPHRGQIEVARLRLARRGFGEQRPQGVQRLSGVLQLLVAFGHAKIGTIPIVVRRHDGDRQEGLAGLGESPRVVELLGFARSRR